MTGDAPRDPSEPSERRADLREPLRPEVVVEALPAGARWHRPVFLGVSALTVITVVALAHEVMLPLVLGLLIAYVLLPLVQWAERRRVPRGVAIVLVYAVVIGGLFTLLRLIAPRIGSEIAGFAKEVPALVAEAKRTWVPKAQERLHALTGGAAPAPDAAPPPPEQPSMVVRPRADGSFEVEVGSGVTVRKVRDGWVVDKRHPAQPPLDVDHMVSESIQGSVEYARQNAFEVARIGGGIVAGVSRFFFVFGLTLMVGAYLMLTKERILRFFTFLVRPSSRASFLRLVDRIDRGLAGVVRGQIIICLINGALSAIGFALVGLKYWPILTIIATLLSLIPIFGSIASAIPAVALGLTQSFGTGIFVLVWIIAIHQLEANVLNPKIMGDQAKIHPVLVIFSLLVGEHFFRTPGALLAVPCMSVAQSLFIHFRQIVQGEDPEMAREPVASIPPPARRAAPPGARR